MAIPNCIVNRTLRSTLLSAATETNRIAEATRNPPKKEEFFILSDIYSEIYESLLFIGEFLNFFKFFPTSLVFSVNFCNTQAFIDDAGRYTLAELFDNAFMFSEFWDPTIPTHPIPELFQNNSHMRRELIRDMTRLQRRLEVIDIALRQEASRRFPSMTERAERTASTAFRRKPTKKQMSRLKNKRR